MKLFKLIFVVVFGLVFFVCLNMSNDGSLD